MRDIWLSYTGTKEKSKKQKEMRQRPKHQLPEPKRLIISFGQGDGVIFL